MEGQILRDPDSAPDTSYAQSGFNKSLQSAATELEARELVADSPLKS